MIPNLSDYTIRSETFVSHGLRCDARLYLPSGVSDPVPVVIMAHGFGARMDFGLHPFADRFAKARMAVFMFDYRGFGKSEGTPRNVVNPFMHVEDWACALEHVQLLPEIDSKRIALWGTSFSGGHALSTAAAHPVVAAVIAQVPFLDGPPTVAQLPASVLLRSTIAGVRDLFRKLTLRSPYYIPIVGAPGTTACMNKPDSFDGFRRLIPASEIDAWENRCAARILLLIAFYRPIKKFASIQAPCLLINAANDSLFRSTTVPKAARMLNKATLVQLECGHFDPYSGEWFEKSIAAQLRFLKHKLLDSCHI